MARETDTLAFKDDEAAVGVKSVRMEQRTTERAKQLIEKAAGLLGVNASEFTVAAATRAAREALKEYEITTISKAQHDAFIRALDATEPTPKLVSLMALEAGTPSK
jgi:uncharacterized protein (DUF1778 family)